MPEKNFIQRDNYSRDNNREKSDKNVFVNQAIKAPTIVVIDDEKNNL